MGKNLSDIKCNVVNILKMLIFNILALSRFIRYNGILPKIMKNVNKPEKNTPYQDSVRIVISKKINYHYCFQIKLVQSSQVSYMMSKMLPPPLARILFIDHEIDEL